MEGGKSKKATEGDREREKENGNETLSVKFSSDSKIYNIGEEYATWRLPGGTV